MRTKNSEWFFRFLAVSGVAILLFSGGGAAEAKTWTVTTKEDSAANAGSLRAIVSKAGKGDTIKFSSGGADLTSPLTLDKSLTIEGPATIKKSWGGLDFLKIPAGQKVVFKKLTIIDDSTSSPVSGCLDNYGELQMKESEVKGKVYVYNNASGTLKMEECMLSGPQGGLFNEGAASLKDCTVKNISGSKDGGGIWNGGGNLKLEGCTVTGNSASGNGGGIFNGAEMELNNCVVTNNSSSKEGGGICNVWKLTLKRTTVSGNSAGNSGGGIYHRIREDWLQIKDKSVIKNNTPDQICDRYEAESNCTIGGSPNSSATVFSGYAGETSPEPRSIVGEEDVEAVASELADPESALFGIVVEALSGDIHETTDEGSAPSSPPVTVELSSVTASLYYANMFEDVAVDEDALAVEYTASWPENVRYYALFSLADGSGYVIPERGVQFELKAGEPLPEGVTPPDFYEAGEGLMTWRNVVADNGPYDHNPAEGVVTFRVCSVRAEAVQRQNSGGGCSVGGVNAWIAALLLVPFLALARKKR